jgi:phytoene synthase
MCTHVFCVTGGAAVRRRALAHARTLGVAMQLTNILRDVGEDARNGRCYLPDEDLERFGLDRAAVLAGMAPRDLRWRALMAFEIDRARALYASAMPGIALLSPDAQRCAAACATGYEAILGAIESNAYDTFGVRAHLGARARASVLWTVWRTRLALPDGDGSAPSHTDPHPDGEMVPWASATHQ